MYTYLPHTHTYIIHIIHTYVHVCVHVRNSPAGRQTTAKPIDRRPKAAFVDKSLRVQGRFFSRDILAFI